MMVYRWMLVLLMVAAGSHAARKKSRRKRTTPPTFGGAQWIWRKDRQGQVDNTACTRYFRGTFRVPAEGWPVKGDLIVTVDNEYTLYVNGQALGESDGTSDSWRRPKRYNLDDVLSPGKNVIAIAATNTAPGWAGLLVSARLTDKSGNVTAIVSDASWRVLRDETADWQQPVFNDSTWEKVTVLGKYGMAPWKQVAWDPKNQPKQVAVYRKETEFTNPIFAVGAVFVRGDLNFRAHNKENFKRNIRSTRAYFENDTPAPAALGRQLCSLIPMRPDGKVRVIADARGGVLGSPTVSYDGKRVYFAMAPKDDPYFHIYCVNPDGSNLRQVTQGAFHDFDPVELPDGRIAFASTRLGSVEEYHAISGFCIFACNPDGSKVRPVTTHIVGDREPIVTAKGALAFIRCDNFLERAKVETHIHETRLDGTGGRVIIGPARTRIDYIRSCAAETDSNWLRKFGAGSPAAMNDGRVLAITQKGLATSESTGGTPIGKGYLPYDVKPLPDGRMLCTDIERTRICIFDPKSREVTEVASLGGKGIQLPPDSKANQSRGYSSSKIHSIVHLGSRPKPLMMPSMFDDKAARSRDKTGFLYCQNVFNTQHNNTDLKRIKAIRVYQGKPFTIAPTRTIYMHVGTEGIELGTVPIAPDGSFYAEVPADRAIALQAVDAEGRAVINELSWIYVRPREQRSCVGCHAAPEAAPTVMRSQAVTAKPIKLLGQGGPHRFRANNPANGGVLNLQLDRFREVANISLYAPLPGTNRLPDRYTDLVAGIQQFPDKLAAIQRLAVLRDRSATPYLVAALNDESPEVRNAAAIALAACGTGEAVPALLSVLNDKSPVVAQAANIALEQLTGATVGIDAFAKDRSSHIARWKAAAADHRALRQTWVANLEAKDAATVQLAIETLGHHRSGENAAVLRSYLNSNLSGELRIIMAAMRAIGMQHDAKAVPLLSKILRDNILKKEGKGFGEVGLLQRPIYLAATAVEALGRIGGSQAETALLETFPTLYQFEDYTHRCGDHTWLMGCHASPLHYRYLEAFYRLGTGAKLKSLVPKIITSVPIDKDRGLLYEPDGYEHLTCQVIRQSGRTAEVINACLAVLGDKGAQADSTLIAAVSASPHAQGHVRKHKPDARAAQLLSIVCANSANAPRIRAIFQRFHAANASESRSWVCFFLLRLIGRLRDKAALPMLEDILANDPTEQSLGTFNPPSHWVYKAMKPFFRSAAAFAIGELHEARSVPVLFAAVTQFENAPAIRQQAAIALGKCGRPGHLAELKSIAEDYPEIATRRSLQDACIAVGMKK